MNMLPLMPHLAPQEIEMILAAKSMEFGELALLRRDRLDVVIDALLEAERRGLFLTEGAACDLACKLMSWRDGLTPSVPTPEQETYRDRGGLGVGRKSR
jgi:hypothetical protein